MVWPRQQRWSASKEVTWWFAMRMALGTAMMGLFRLRASNRLPEPA